MTMFRLFFSNRQKDQERVDELQAKLRDLLPNLPFHDVSKDVPVADDWKVHAQELLKSCDAVICVAGEDTHASEPVDWEIRQARQLGKPLIITRLSLGCQLPPCCDELHIEPIDWKTAEVAGQIGELLISRALFSEHDVKNSHPTHDAISNQYNVMVQSWESLISRRQTVNSLYVAIATALLAGVGGVISTFDKTGPMATAIGVAVLAVFGAALSFNWHRTVISYGILSRAKSKVIGALEAHMPARLFDAEWKLLEAKRYKSTTDTDRQTAFTFMVLFVAVAVSAVGFALGQLLWR